MTQTWEIALSLSLINLMLATWLIVIIRANNKHLVSERAKLSLKELEYTIKELTEFEIKKL